MCARDVPAVVAESRASVVLSFFIAESMAPGGNSGVCVAAARIRSMLARDARSRCSVWERDLGGSGSSVEDPSPLTSVGRRASALPGRVGLRTAGRRSKCSRNGGVSNPRSSVTSPNIASLSLMKENISSCWHFTASFMAREQNGSCNCGPFDSDTAQLCRAQRVARATDIFRGPRRNGILDPKLSGAI